MQTFTFLTQILFFLLLLIVFVIVGRLCYQSLAKPKTTPLQLSTKTIILPPPGDIQHQADLPQNETSLEEFEYVQALNYQLKSGNPPITWMEL